MSIQDLGRDVPNPPNHSAAVKLAEQEQIPYSEALQWTCKDGVVYFAEHKGWPLRYKEHAREIVDAHNAAIKQYENLKGQGWFHPDIVNELRSQLADLPEIERSRDAWKRQCAEALKKLAAAQVAIGSKNKMLLACEQMLVTLAKKFGTSDEVRDAILGIQRAVAISDGTSCLDAYIDEAVDKSQRDYLWSRSELRRELLSLRKALEPFAHIANEIPTNRQQLGILTDDDFTNARTAMQQGSELYKEIIAGAQQPLVDALKRGRRGLKKSLEHLGCDPCHLVEDLEAIDAALAKLKEQP